MSKKVLITGANSYVGTSVEHWLGQWTDSYKVDTIDMVDGTWRERTFGSYDIVFHVAGIAHADVGQVSEEQKALYYKINTDLAVETAEKAKRDGVKQFIFMSSMIVYGDSAPIGKRRVISKNTLPHPSNFYGDSKLQAEKRIYRLRADNFKVVILRPPMIYGKGSKGNYPTLSKLAQKMLVFPNIQNERSMLHIENLCEFVRMMMEREEDGIFFPQNREYVQTSYMVSLIGEMHGKKVYLWKGLNILVWCLSKIPGKFKMLVNKAFGSLVYEKTLSEYQTDYRVNDFRTSILKTESEIR